MISSSINYKIYHQWLKRVSIVGSILCLVPILFSTVFYGLGVMHLVALIFLLTCDETSIKKNRIVNAVLMVFYLIVTYVLFEVLGYEEFVWRRNNIDWGIVLLQLQFCYLFAPLSVILLSIEFFFRHERQV